MHNINIIPHNESDHSLSTPKMENWDINGGSRKRNHSVKVRGNLTGKKLRMNETVVDNEGVKVICDSQDECRPDKSHSNYKIIQSTFSHPLIRLMYKLDLSILCTFRKNTYEHRYPSAFLVFDDLEIDKFNDIVLCYDEVKYIHVQIEYIDKYYKNNDINYVKLFTKKKQSFSINNYFDNFVKHLIYNLDSSLNNIDYLIIYTNSGLDLTEEKKLKKGRSKNFYPFQFDSIDMKKCHIINDLLFTNRNINGRDFYQFSRDKTTREELLKRLEFSLAMHKVIAERKLSKEFENELKETFLNKLVFAVNQPNREELNMIIRSEVEKVQCNYIKLQEELLYNLSSTDKVGNNISEIIYGFNLFISFLHDMFLHKKLSSINCQNNSTCNDITIHYKNKITHIKPYNADSKITYRQLFPSKNQKKINKFSINKHFSSFIDELQKNKNIKHFIIYTDACLSLTKDNSFKKSRSKDSYPFKFDKVDIQKKKYKVLRNCFCIKSSGLYQFAHKEITTISNLLCLPSSVEMENGRIFHDNENELKEQFLNKLLFASNQFNYEELNSVIKREIKKSDVPYNYAELNEIALRCLEPHEFGPITEELIANVFDDIKNYRSSHKIQDKKINDEIKFAKSVVGSDSTPVFNEFLDYLIKNDGKNCLEVMKRNGIKLTTVSSILDKSRNNAIKAFKYLYDLWFDEEGNKTQCLITLENNKINLTIVSNILSGAGYSGASAFENLYNLWFDDDGNKRKYLKAFEERELNLTNISSMLSKTGSNAAKIFEDLYNLWFDEHGNETKYLQTLENNGLSLAIISNILHGAGANVVKAFKDLYDFWFDEEGNKTCYLRVLEKNEISLVKMSNILGNAGSNAAKVFENLHYIWFNVDGNKSDYLKYLEENEINLTIISNILNGTGYKTSEAFIELYNTFCDEEGNKTQHLKRFMKKKIGFTILDLSNIISGAGASVKIAFEKLHDTLFNEKGKKTELLHDFYNANFKPSNLSTVLYGSGARAASVLIKLHSVCFDENRETTKVLNDFLQANFSLDGLCNILRGAADYLKNFHTYCFTVKTKKYLYHFLNCNKNFTPNDLSNVLHGTGFNVCIALKDFHDVCYDEIGNETQLLNDFYDLNFTPKHLSNVLSMSGNNASVVFQKFHKICFNKRNYLNHFITNNEIFTPKKLSKILHGVGLDVRCVFKNLHDLCFDKAGNKTNYLNDLIENHRDEMYDILHVKIKNGFT